MALNQYSNSDKDWLLDYMDEYGDVLDASDPENPSQSHRDLPAMEYGGEVNTPPGQEDELLQSTEDMFLQKAKQKSANSQEFQHKFREAY